MLSIAIYSDIPKDIENLKSMIQDFLIDVKMMAKVSYFNDPDAFITVPSSYDIYIMDMDAKNNILELGKQMKDIDVGAHFVYLSSDESVAYLAAKARVDYFIMKPLDRKEMIEILKEIK